MKSEHLRDPELDRLIHELNRGGAARAAGEEAPGGDVGSMAGVAVADEPAEPAEPAEPGAGEAALPAATPTPNLKAATIPPSVLPRTAAAAAPAAVGFAAEAPPQVEVDGRSALGALLIDTLRRGASDLLLLPGMPPVFRIDGRLKRSEAAPLSSEGVGKLFEAQLVGRMQRSIDERGSADFSLQLSGAALGDREAASGGREAGRFRVNVHRQMGQLAAALRSLPHEIPTLAALNLPQGLGELIKPSRGLVLVCGPTGSGKSSTLAALIGEINRTRTAHIITIEDPVEYEHRSNRSLIEHVEIGRDARTFSEALRAALRQDPDVILVGEMRDLDTVATAVTAAETGHLVLATLHSNDAVQAVHRIVDVFPPVQQEQIRQQLALSLHAVIAQQLVPRSDGRGRLPAIELMLASFPVRSHIRNDQLQKLYNEITLGRRIGMTSFEESLAVLVRDNKISLEEARVRASHPEEFDARLRG